MKTISSVALLSLISILSSTAHATVLPQTAKPKPVLSGNFADPSIIKVGNTWYAFATNDRREAKDNQGPNVQVSTSTDFKKWSKVDEKNDALRDVGCWADKGKAGADVWAPHVVELPNPRKFRENQYIMYYSARHADKPNRQCISAAVATNVTGPYLPRSQPIACHTERGGAIHPAGFQDSDGKLYVVYKVDGNAIGKGGVCGNSNKPIQSTPIMLQGLRDDGVTPEGAPKQLLDRGDGDGPLVEAPSLVKKGDTYFLFFSSQCATDSNYDTSFATSKSLCGPYKKTDKPLLLAGGKMELVGPGSSMITPNGENVAFQALVDKKRSMFVGKLSYKDNYVTVNVESG